jgi:hypothetical protein
MNIVSGSQLSRDGYHFEYVTNRCSISKDGIFYVYVPDRDFLYVLDLDCNETHIKASKMKHRSTMWMPRDVSLVLIIPSSCGIVVLVMLA